MTRLTCRSSGLALPAVLWTLAALSLLLGSFVMFARVQTQLTTTLVDQQRTRALMAAGVTYVQAALSQDQRLSQQPPLDASIELDGQPVQLHLVNVAGLIDLNAAEDTLATQLLQRELQWPVEKIQAFLAHRRSQPAPAFPSLSDLRRAPGMDAASWARLAPLVTVHGGSSGVNVLLAPLDVLSSLLPNNPRAVQAFDRARREPGQTPDLTLINSPHHQPVSVGAYRLDITVTLGEGRTWRHRYWLVRDNRQGNRLRVADHHPLPAP